MGEYHKKIFVVYAKSFFFLQLVNIIHIKRLNTSANINIISIYLPVNSKKQISWINQ